MRKSSLTSKQFHNIEGSSEHFRQFKNIQGYIPCLLNLSAIDDEDNVRNSDSGLGNVSCQDNLSDSAGRNSERLLLVM